MKNLTSLSRLALRNAARLAARIIAGLTTLHSARGALLQHWDFNSTGDPVHGASMTLVANPAGEGVLKIGHIVKDTVGVCCSLPMNNPNMMPKIMPKIHIPKSACLPVGGFLATSDFQLPPKP